MTLQASVTALYQRASAAGMFDAPYVPATPAEATIFATIRSEASALLNQLNPATPSLRPYYDLLHRLAHNRPAPL